MKWFNWGIVRLILMLVIVAFLYSFTGNRNNLRKLKGSEVVFVGSDQTFVGSDAVNKLLIENRVTAKSIRKENLALNKLEKSINKHEMVEKSEVFVSIDGVLKAVVQQKTPIARVFAEDESFYIDYKGSRMPLSEHYTARVPVISGSVREEQLTELAGIFRVIYDDPFLKKNIIGAKVSQTGNISMQARNFSYTINFGKPINAEKKFANYKAFLQKSATDSTAAAYRKVNLTFTSQVICTK
jgi:cell division protein FtsQ